MYLFKGTLKRKQLVPNSSAAIFNMHYNGAEKTVNSRVVSFAFNNKLEDLIKLDEFESIHIDSLNVNPEFI